MTFANERNIQRFNPPPSTQSQNNDQFRGRSYGGAGLLLNPTIITRALQYHLQIQTSPTHMMMVLSAVQF